MNYLQIIYQREAFQMWKMIKEEVFQLACKVVRYGFTKNSPYNNFLWNIKFVLTNYLQQLLYISKKQSDLYMLVTTVKGLTCSNYKVKVNNMNIHSIADGLIKLEAIIIIM